MLLFTLFAFECSLQQSRGETKIGIFEGYIFLSMILCYFSFIIHKEIFWIIVGFMLFCKLAAFVAQYIYDVSNQNMKIVV